MSTIDGGILAALEAVVEESGEAAVGEATYVARRLSYTAGGTSMSAAGADLPLPLPLPAGSIALALWGWCVVEYIRFL